MTEYTNLYLPSTHPIPTMSLIEDSHKLMFESDEDMVPIEYLESTGAQWINTGIIGDLNTEIEIKFNATETNGYVCGNNDTSSRAISIFAASTANQRFGDKTYVANIPINTLHTIVSNKNGITINGTTYTRTTTTEFTTAAQLYIFKGQTSATTGGKLKVYYFKVRKNGKLIADFIPVRRGTDGCMFDTVSKKIFERQGTSSKTFTLGPDIVPVEYLQSTGTQYIDTGILQDSSLALDVDFNVSAYKQEGLLCSRTGTTSKAHGFIFPSSPNTIRYTRGDGTGHAYATPNNWALNEWHNVRCSGDDWWFDGVKQSAPTNTNKEFTSNTLTYYLFACNTNGTVSNLGTKKIRKCTIVKNGETVLDLISVRVGTVGYMYDKVSHKLFANAGTGSFVIGEDDPYTKITRKSFK